MGLLSLPKVLFWGLIFFTLLFELDIFSKRKKSGGISLKSAATRITLYILMAICFATFIFISSGRELASQFIAGYLLEMILSLDNIFVFILIFSSFNVPEEYQNKVLFFGILGALILRGIFIFGGVALVNAFHGVLLLFALILLASGVKVIIDVVKKSDEEDDIKHNKLIKLLNRYLPITPSYHGDHFFARVNHMMYITPLFVVLISLTVADVVFAFDSIPAIFSVSKDSFIIYTSNIFAILGLRSMFFLLAKAVKKFRYLKHALSVVLIFIGAKMVINYFIEDFITIGVSLLIVVLTMVSGVIASIQKKYYI